MTKPFDNLSASQINKLYDEFLGERGGHVSHELLHTEYYDKSNVYADAEC